mmetsp:Transcript_74730/g.123944  ORF Transcript_74730/g.123944 Transcript_74730/m.123944 type:complete len:463 (-) Transcript_74730:60-1448(-)
MAALRADGGPMQGAAQDATPTNPVDGHCQACQVPSPQMVCAKASESEDLTGAPMAEQPLPERPSTDSGLAHRQANSLELTMQMLRSLVAQGEAAAAVDCGATSQDAEAARDEAPRHSAPSLQAFCELPAEQVATRCLVLLRYLSGRNVQAAAAASAERQVLAWAHEWLDLGQDNRMRFLKLLVDGLIGLSPAFVAKHLVVFIELRLSCWEPSADPDAGKRHARGIRAGRAALVALAALEADELDTLGEAFVETLHKGLSPLGAAKIVVRLPPHRRVQLERLLVYDDILPAEQAKRAFNAMTWLISTLGVDHLDATLSALDSALFFGSGALGAGSYALGTLSSIGSDAMSTVGTTMGTLRSGMADFSSGVAYVISDAAAASAGAAAAMLFNTTPDVPNGYPGACTQAVEGEDSQLAKGYAAHRASSQCSWVRSSLQPSTSRRAVEQKRRTVPPVLPSQKSDFI